MYTSLQKLRNFLRALKLVQHTSWDKLKQAATQDPRKNSFREKFRSLTPCETRLKQTRKNVKVSRLSRNTLLYEYQVKIRGLPECFDGFSILHFSDIHFWESAPYRAENFQLIASKLRKQFSKTDLIAITGDTIVDKATDLSEVALQGLTTLSSEGTSALFVLGNHDYYGRSSQAVANGLESVGYINCANTPVVLRPEQNMPGIGIYGIDDFLMGNPVNPEVESTKDVNILLTHNLDALNSGSEDVYDIVLSGHWHAGEMKLGPIDLTVLKKVLGLAGNFNDHIAGWCCFTERCLSFVSPGMARHYFNLNVMAPGVARITLVGE